MKIGFRGLLAGVLIGLVAAFAVGGVAEADVVQFSAPAVSGSTALNTFLFDEITITSIGFSTVTQTDDGNGIIGPADSFLETGLVAAVNFQLGGLNVPVATSGIGLNYELIADFTLTGTAALVGTDIVATITGLTATIFYDEIINSAIDGATAVALATIPLGAPAIAGDCVITAATNFSEGSCQFIAGFDAGGVTDSGVWTIGGIDIGLLGAQITFDINVDEINPPFLLVYPGGPGSAQVAELDHDGSARIDIAQVPAPATLLLLGIGLVALGVSGRRRVRN